MPERPSEATARPPVLPCETRQTSSPQTLSTSALTETAPPSESNREEEEAGGAELKVAAQTAEFEDDAQSWSRPWVSTLFQISNAPSAPALYPSLPTLDEGSAMQLCEEAVKNSETGPAVLALPEQESSPPSLQLVDSVVELSRSKLYPELPKTAPEIQVISQTKK